MNEGSLPPEPGEVTQPNLGLEGTEEPILKDDDQVDWPTEVNDNEEDGDE